VRLTHLSAAAWLISIWAFRFRRMRNIYAGFSHGNYDLAWSPDSKWIAYLHSLPNHLHALFLYSVETGQSTKVTSEMADSHPPAFDRDGNYASLTRLLLLAAGYWKIERRRSWLMGS